MGFCRPIDSQFGAKDGIGCSIFSVVLKKALVTMVSLGLLSALGMPLHRPCCSMKELASPAMRDFDCCSVPDCCRNEKRGAAPLVLSSKSVLTSPHVWASPAFAPSTSTLTVTGQTHVLAIGSWHGPPGMTADLPVLLSTLRV
jgi:hypothetical protein